jgi:hypothetical protein
MEAKQFKIIFLTFLSTVKFQAILFRRPLYEQSEIRLKLSTCFTLYIFQKLLTSNVNICLWKRDRPLNLTTHLLTCTISTSTGKGKCCLFTCQASTEDIYEHSSTNTRLWGYKVGHRHAPAALFPGRRPDIHCTGGWVVLGPVWMGPENIATAGVREPPNHPSHSESLYW